MRPMPVVKHPILDEGALQATQTNKELCSQFVDCCS
jgi:hypothetical protein